MAALFLSLAFMLRLSSFHRSVIDWDESLYFLMAEAWRQGHLPYTTLWDNKPIGVYAIFAAFQTIFGDTIASMRIAAVTAVAATAFCLYRVSFVIGGGEPRSSPIAAFLPGLLYLCCSLRDGGMAANTEIFIAPFVCAAMLIALTPREIAARAYFAGLLIGLAIIVKYVAVFEALAVLAALLMRAQPDLTISGLPRVLVPFGVGAATPMAAAFLLYVVSGHADVFITASLLGNVHRLDMPFSLSLAWHAFRDHAKALKVLYLAAMVLPLYVVVGLDNPSKATGTGRPAYIAVVLLLWIVGGFIGTASAKSFYDHYFLQPLPALCLATVWLTSQFLPLRGLRGIVLAGLLLFQPVWGAATAIETTLAPVRLDQNGIGWLRDEPARIAVALRPKLDGTAGVKLYVFDSEPILYSLTGASPPTRYAFPSFIISRFLSHVANVAPAAEFQAIMDRHPEFIVCSRIRHPTERSDNMEIYRSLAKTLRSNYRVAGVFDNAVVYQRNEP